MTALNQLLAELHQRDIRLWVEDDRLRFDAPRGALTEDLKARLREHKPELINAFQGTGDEAELPAVATVADSAAAGEEGDDALPLSHQQERLWFLDRLVEDSRAYNIPAFLRLRGAVSVTALEHAFAAVECRHESLRAVFPEHRGRPRQQLRPVAPHRLPVVDLTALDPSLVLDEWRRLTSAEAQRPFDLGAGPLLRTALLRLRGQEAVLVVNMHHIVSDRWSTGVMLHELAILYRRALDTAPGPSDPRLLADALEPLSVQYRHYARWQQQVRDHPRIHRQLDFWRELLAGDLPILDLPISRVRPGPVRFEGHTLPFRLTPEVSQGLKNLARQEGVTLFMLLLAAFKILLYRYSGQRDLLVGTPIANRGDASVEGLVGFFANTLVLRTGVAEGVTFRSFLEAVRRVALDAFHHQDVAFEKVVEAVNPERDLRRNPVFQVVFVLNTDEVPTFAMGAAEVEPVVLDTSSAKFDLLLALQDGKESLSGFLEYDVDLFPESSIARLQVHFAALLSSIVERPWAKVDGLSMITAAERRQILERWNDTAAPYDNHRCLHQLFEERVALHPDWPAAVCGGETLSYGELNRRANRIAHYLRRRGVVADELVVVCFRRSLDMVAGLLAVLKAGGAYVPLDPAYPRQRMENILGRVNARLLVSQSGVLDDELETTAELLLLDQQSFDDQPEHDPTPVTTADHLAYVIFTSGSTGEPKGVILQHRPVTNLVQWVNGSFRVGRGDRLLFVTSLCFDLSVYDIFGVLAAGAEIYIATEAELEDPAELARVLCEQQITFWDSAPAALQRLAPFLYAGRGINASLRLIFLSGDWIPLSLPPAMLAAFPTCQFVGLGGATEAAIWSNFFVVDGVEDGWRSVPYGKPIQNATYYTLDDQLALCPVGVPGDLYIGGRCLSFGYHGQPALTAQRYLPDPYSQDPGGVLYSTGDRAMRWADGNLEFLGRLDEQVKIRGFRIELGEIEAVLRKHPAVVETKVLARELSPGERGLVAYVQTPQPVQPQSVQPPSGQSQQSSEQLSVSQEARDHLLVELVAWVRQSLPEYMVPAAFVTLEQWPVTSNGKLDRKALPLPQRGAAAASRPPQSPTEQALAAIWSELLTLDRLGADDNFFDLGGHSLLATQVISELRAQRGLELPLRELFAHPTVAALAARVDDLEGIAGHLTPLLVPVDRAGHLPLSFSQERMWFLNRLEPDSGVYNIPAALRLRGPLHAVALAAALRRVVERQDGLRTYFEEGQISPQQKIVDHCPSPLPVVDLGGLPAARREPLALELAERDAELPFRLNVAPLFRTTLLRLGDDDHIILLNLHHIVSDGWSTGVMMREFVHFYNAHRRGEAAQLEPPRVQYVDFAVWQRQRFEAGDLDRQLAYWRDELEGIPPALELPTDRPRQGAFRFHGGAHRWGFPDTLARDLKALMKERDVTLFILLLTGFLSLLQRYSGQQDVVVGSPVANRNRKETESLIGLFVNTLVLRGRLGADPTFLELLDQVKDTAVAAYDHQDLPFEKLVEEINPDRDLSRNPLFQIVFMVQNALTAPPVLDDLALEVVPVENRTAKFDLTMDLEERPDRLLGRVEYNADILDGSTVQRMMGQYVRLLEDAVAHPRRRVEELSLLSAGERHQALVGWNDTDTPTPGVDTLHELFEEQARGAPGALAARCGDVSLTYGDLQRQAHVVAWEMAARGVGRGDLVAVCFPRCLEMLPGLLGILHCGAAYVPLDPAYPAQRMETILQRTGARLLLTHPRLAAALEAHLVDLDVDVWALEGRALDARAASDPSLGTPPRRAEGKDLAYIIFTSGSTGEPKGVVLQHRPVVNLIRWVNATFRVGPDDRLLFLTSLCFDLSVYDIFGILAAGATVDIAEDEDLGQPERLLAKLEEGRVTFWDSAPAALQQLVPFLPTEGRGSLALRRVFLSGDWVPLSLPPVVMEAFPNARVVALGGATEAAIWSNFHPLEEIQPHWLSVPYGRPIDNARYHVLDRYLRPSPMGVPGDLYIGRDCLSSHYFRQPRLTARRYVPDPFSERGGDVLYTTGDRARWVPGGSLEFLGRLDHQVKIRGYRIELGEVEAVLRQHLAVEEAVALAREDRPGHKELVAYVELATGETEVPEVLEALRAALQERLPDYMMPSHLLVLDGWPVTANGKLDREALPAPTVQAVVDGGPTPPRTTIERVLVGLWADVLGLPAVGVHDDFFALGGHSILVAQLVGRVRAAFGIDLSIRKLFEESTVARLAVTIENALEGADAEALPPLERWPEPTRTPLSYAQERLWVQYALDPDSGAYNVPVAIRIRGPLRLHSLHRALAEVVRRHDSLRTVFRATEQGAMAAVQDDVRLRFQQVDLSGVPADEREAVARRLADAEAAAPFRLEEGPPIRSAVLVLDSRDHLLVVTVHHIVFDGLSVGVLIRELSALYESFIRAQRPRLGQLTFQYGDFAAWQRQWLKGQTLDEHLDFWQQTLADAPPYLELPSPRPRPPVMTDRGGVLPFHLGGQERAALVALGNHYGCTPFMTLLAAFKVLIYHHTRQLDVVVGTDVGGRSHAALEPMVGFFVNQVALRTRLDESLTFAEVLKRVRASTLEAYQHQDAPFHKVVERLNPPRDRSRTPLVQLMFVYQESPGAELRLAGLELEEVLLGGQAVKSEVWLNIWPQGEGLGGRLEFNLDVLARSQMEHFLRQLTILLGKVAYDAERTVASLDRLAATVETGDQRKQLKKIGKSLFQRRQRPAAENPLRMVKT